MGLLLGADLPAGRRIHPRLGRGLGQPGTATGPNRGMNLSSKSTDRSPEIDQHDATISSGNAPFAPFVIGSADHGSGKWQDPMKRGVFVFTVAMTAAGVASALTLAPIAQAPPRPSQVASKPPSDPVPVVGAAKSTLEARQAPVPLLVKPRTPANSTASGRTTRIAMAPIPMGL